jgi:hypothetical protein
MTAERDSTMTDNRALWELVEKWKTRAEPWCGDGTNRYYEIHECTSELIAILECPVEVGDEDVERAISASNSVLFAGNWEPKDYTEVLLQAAMRAALESMVRGKS